MCSPHTNTINPPADKYGAIPKVAPKRVSLGSDWSQFIKRMIKIPITAGISNPKDIKSANIIFGTPQNAPIATASLPSPAPNLDLGAIQIRKNIAKLTLAPIKLSINPF